MSAPRTAAILPVKRFGAAKQRLGASVSPELRLELARAMVEDVLEALALAEGVERTIVVTGEDTIAGAAASRGAEIVEDLADGGQSAAVSLGVARALELAIPRVLCVPGDCPALDPGELGALLRDCREQIVIVPDRHGTGTNALLLRPPGVIEPSFGPGSCERHVSLARGAGASFRIERVPSLVLDIDTRADLDVLRGRLAGAPAGAPRTRRALSRSQDDDDLPGERAAAGAR